MTDRKTIPQKSKAATEPPKKRTWTEEIEVAGDKLVAEVKRLAAEGQVKRIRITEPDGDLIVELPLTVGAIAGGAVVLAAPFLAVIGAIAAFVTKVKIEVIRSGDPADKPRT
ncbi:DUF4342 domain-containing protein [Tabrizicola thermarum]|uniref:DUF4342 domain-containing protein n=1 Tax=Tabrizicola thermarum TaxID=2670345 RepID=UPI000FFBFFD6|nr:DUF4342 domain-containing protein [Tabrizicola thermarum]